MALTCNLSTQQAEAGRLPLVQEKPGQVQGHLEQHNKKPVSKKKKKVHYCQDEAQTMYCNIIILKEVFLQK